MAGKLTILLALMATASAKTTSCEDGSCKVPQDELSLIQTRLEPSPREGDNRKETSGLDEAAATQEIKEAVEEGKRELRESLKSKSRLLPFSDNACPSGWDNTETANGAVINFIERCLKHVQPASGKGAGNAGKDAWIRGAMDKCGGGVTNSMHHAGNQTFNVKASAKEGGICEAKVYQVKCNGGKIPAGCTMYRAYAQGNRAMGGYWGPDPRSSDLTKAEYRDAYAICNDWQNGLDLVTAATMTDKACGTLVMIGNGEKVTNCNPKSEVYPYSQYLQMIPCAARDTAGYFTTQEGLTWH